MNDIMDYMMRNLEMTEKTAKRNAEKISKYDDIKEEFKGYMTSRSFPFDGLIVEGYTAYKIHNMAPFMNEVGVYNFLVSLRDCPEMAKKIISDGFPLK